MLGMTYLSDLYRAFMWRRDPRVRDWPLMGEWGIVMAGSIIALYGLMVIYGPRLVRKHQPVNVKYPMTLYNVIQVILCAYMCWEFLISAIMLRMNPVCTPIDISDNPYSVRLVKVCWLFMFSKIIDMVDTSFMILKGDRHRLTFLHVFHHGSVFFSWWLVVMFSPGGVGFTGGVINALVHCVMYAYYQLSSMGPAVKKHLWWKPYLTILQMLQFCSLIGVATLTQLPGLRCGYPLWISLLTFAYMFVLLLFFINFYLKTYRKGRWARRKTLGANKHQDDAHAQQITQTKPAPIGLFAAQIAQAKEPLHCR